jgi:hypothetical protein
MIRCFRWNDFSVDRHLSYYAESGGHIVILGWLGVILLLASSPRR